MGSRQVAVPEQLVAYVRSTATGRPGVLVPVSRRPRQRGHRDPLLADVILIGLAEVVAIFAGLLLGAYAGWRRGSAVDRIGNGLGLIFYSMPYFVIGMPLIIIFATNLGWFPTSGMLTPGASYTSFLDQLLDFTSHLILPLTTIALGLIGGYSILMRSSVIETRTEDYVTTARAKGLSDGYVLRNHAFPERPAADRHGHRHQPRVRRRRRPDRGDHLQLAGSRNAHLRRARRPRLPGPPGGLPGPVDLGRAGQPRGRHRV